MVYRQTLIVIRERHLPNPDIISHRLQLAMTVLDTGDTALGHGYVAQTDITGLAAVPPLTLKTGMGMLRQHQL
jgi:hypothetical protein